MTIVTRRAVLAAENRQSLFLALEGFDSPHRENLHALVQLLARNGNRPIARGLLLPNAPVDLLVNLNYYLAQKGVALYFSSEPGLFCTPDRKVWITEKKRVSPLPRRALPSKPRVV